MSRKWINAISVGTVAGALSLIAATSFAPPEWIPDSVLQSGKSYVKEHNIPPDLFAEKTKGRNVHIYRSGTALGGWYEKINRAAMMGGRAIRADYTSQCTKAFAGDMKEDCNPTLRKLRTAFGVWSYEFWSNDEPGIGFTIAPVEGQGNDSFVKMPPEDQTIKDYIRIFTGLPEDLIENTLTTREELNLQIFGHEATCHALEKPPSATANHTVASETGCDIKGGKFYRAVKPNAPDIDNVLIALNAVGALGVRPQNPTANGNDGQFGHATALSLHALQNGPFAPRAGEILDTYRSLERKIFATQAFKNGTDIHYTFDLAAGILELQSKKALKTDLEQLAAQLYIDSLQAISPTQYATHFSQGNMPKIASSQQALSM